MKVSKSAVETALYLGLAASASEAEVLLERWVECAAPVSSDLGNRVYGVFYLTVEDGVLDDLQVPDNVHRWCLACYGTGIVDVPVGSIRCPECST